MQPRIRLHALRGRPCYAAGESGAVCCFDLLATLWQELPRERRDLLVLCILVSQSRAGSGPLWLPSAVADTHASGAWAHANLVCRSLCSGTALYCSQQLRMSICMFQVPGKHGGAGQTGLA